MSYKYFVGGGCSFSDGGDSWIYKLPKKLNIKKVLNLARGSCGNEFIKTNAIFRISQLLRDGVNPKDILIGIQWTGTCRLDMMVDKENTVTPNNFNDDLNLTELGYEQFEGGKGKFMASLEHIDHFKKYSDRGWVHSGGANNFLRMVHTSDDFQDVFFSHYFKYYFTEEMGYRDFLNNVLMFQWFCKSNGLSFFNCTGWDNINSYERHFHKTLSPDEVDLLTKSMREVHDKKDFKPSHLENYTEQRYLFDMIDFNRFIFVESDMLNFVMGPEFHVGIKGVDRQETEYGGMWQYMVERGGINPDDRHPNKDGHNMWTEYLYDEITKKNICEK